MIVGNPYKFAIIAQKIEEWNSSDTFCNGVLFFCVAGELFPRGLDTATLSTEQVFWKDKLDTIVANNGLYNLPTYEAFVSMYNLVFPSDSDDRDYRFDFSPQTLCPANSNFRIFVVSNGEYVRIMAAMLKYDKAIARDDLTDISISETIIRLDEFKNIFCKSMTDA